MRTHTTVANAAAFVGPFFLAPGSTIASSVVGGGCKPQFGTSVSAPDVFGPSALGRAVNPTASVADWTVYLMGHSVADMPAVALPDLPSPVTIKRIRLRDGV